MWKAAANKLDDELKSCLASDKTEVDDIRIVNAVELSLRQITHQREEHGEKSWKHKDKTTKMLQSVMAFKSLVDAGVKLDPTGYGKEEKLNSIKSTYFNNFHRNDRLDRNIEWPASKFDAWLPSISNGALICSRCG